MGTGLCVGDGLCAEPELPDRVGRGDLCRGVFDGLGEVGLGVGVGDVGFGVGLGDVGVGVGVGELGVGVALGLGDDDDGLGVADAVGLALAAGLTDAVAAAAGERATVPATRTPGIVSRRMRADRRRLAAAAQGRTGFVAEIFASKLAAAPAHAVRDPRQAG